jgi:hypothetical protein
MTPLPGGYSYDYRFVLLMRTLLGALGVVLLVMLARLSASDSRRRRRLERELIAVAVLSVFAWTNFGGLRGPNRPVHMHDVFHYYIGAKYYPELEYTRFYDCIATAEIDDGRGIDVARRWHRDLQTNELVVQAPTLPDQDECRGRFGSRWGLFRSDVEWFRQHMTADMWKEVYIDHGFNATPTWAAAAHWMIGGSPVSARQVLGLSALDYVLLAVMSVLIWRTFGAVVCSIAALWWALAELTSFPWLGGTFLRQDALLCLVAAACGLKAGRSRAAGACLSAAVLLRAYPIVILAGPAIHILHGVRQTGLRRIASNSRGLMVGFAAGSIALMAFTAITWGPSRLGATEPWRGFLAKAEKQVNTQYMNNLGLQTVLSFSESSRFANLHGFWLDGPLDTWQSAQNAVFQSRLWIYRALILAFLTLLVLALRKTEDWIALVLGIALLPIVMDLTNYYYSVPLLFAFLWPLDPLIGLALAAVSLLTTIMPTLMKMADDRAVVNSFALILLSVWTTYRVGFSAPFRPALTGDSGSSGVAAAPER